MVMIPSEVSRPHPRIILSSRGITSTTHCTRISRSFPPLWRLPNRHIRSVGGRTAAKYLGLGLPHVVSDMLSVSRSLVQEESLSRGNQDGEEIKHLEGTGSAD